MQLCLLGVHRAGPRRDGATLLLLRFLLLQTDSALILLLANFLTGTLAGESGFYAFFLPRFQVKGVAFDLFDDVFLLHFALEAAQGVLQRLTLLQSNFRQTDTPPNQSGRTE